MKSLLMILYTLLLISLNIIATAQVCDTILSGQQMNCKDKLGKKQGKWITVDYWSQNPDTFRTPYISSLGEYKNNKKKGEWTYVQRSSSTNVNITEVSYRSRNIKEVIYNDYSTGPVKTIYKKNSVIKKVCASRNYKYSISYTKEGRRIRGQCILDHFRSDYVPNIDIICDNDSCSFALKGGFVILTFFDTNTDYLDYQLFRLTGGLYDREIMKLIMKDQPTY